jgi:PadR family transcriptional regulator, regulatory protein PadR
MPSPLRSDNLQGTLDLLILKTLASRDTLHGYAISTHIQQISDDFLRVEEGSLYPALHRIEGLGWISSKWGMSSTNRRVKLYTLTATGRRQLESEQKRWDDLTAAVRKVLECYG